MELQSSQHLYDMTKILSRDMSHIVTFKHLKAAIHAFSI